MEFPSQKQKQKRNSKQEVWWFIAQDGIGLNVDGNFLSKNILKIQKVISSGKRKRDGKLC